MLQSHTHIYIHRDKYYWHNIAAPYRITARFPPPTARPPHRNITKFFHGLIAMPALHRVLMGPCVPVLQARHSLPPPTSNHAGARCHRLPSDPQQCGRFTACHVLLLPSRTTVVLPSRASGPGHCSCVLSLGLEGGTPPTIATTWGIIPVRKSRRPSLTIKIIQKKMKSNKLLIQQWYIGHFEYVARRSAQSSSISATRR